MQVTPAQNDILEQRGQLSELQKNCGAIQEILEMRDRYIYYDQETHKHPMAVTVDGATNCEVIRSLARPDVRSRMRGGIFRL